MQRLWKSVQWILRYIGSERTSRKQNKICCHGNVPWDIEKNFRSIMYTQNAFIWYKNCKNCTWFVFCLQHTIGCHGNVPSGIEKNWSWSRKFTQMPSIWWKDRENRSSRYWDRFARSKKNKEEEVNASKIYSPVGNLAERAKQCFSACINPVSVGQVEAYIPGCTFLPSTVYPLPFVQLSCIMHVCMKQYLTTHFIIHTSRVAKIQQSAFIYLAHSAKLPTELYFRLR